MRGPRSVIPTRHLERDGVGLSLEKRLKQPRHPRCPVRHGAVPATVRPVPCRGPGPVPRRGQGPPQGGEARLPPQPLPHRVEGGGRPPTVAGWGVGESPQNTGRWLSDCAICSQPRSVWALPERGMYRTGVSLRTLGGGGLHLAGWKKKVLTGLRRYPKPKTWRKKPKPDELEFLREVKTLKVPFFPKIDSLLSEISGALLQQLFGPAGLRRADPNFTSADPGWELLAGWACPAPRLPPPPEVESPPTSANPRPHIPH